jgi:precorrin-6Y C5,15-methyltransferase (decarboxylating)
VRPWLAVIGIGEDGIAGLSPAARMLIEIAEVFHADEELQLARPPHHRPSE